MASRLAFPRPAQPSMLTLPAAGAPMAALVLASLMWGTSDVAGKLALTAIPPVTLAALRFGVAFAILWPLSRRQSGPRVPVRVTAPLGLIGVALTFLFQNLGLDRTTATNASLLQGAVPVMTLLLAAVVLRERLGRQRIVTVAVVTAGVAVVTLPGGGGLHAPGLGDLLVLASAACFATFVVLGRRAFPIYGTLPVLAGMAGWGMAALAPAALIELRLGRGIALDMEAAGLVLYLGAGCSALTYGLWGYALSRIEAGRAATFDTLIPVVGVVSAVMILGERVMAWHVIGGALVVAGVWMVVHEAESSPVVETMNQPVLIGAGRTAFSPAD